MERLSRLSTWLSEAYDLWIATPLAWILLGVFYMFYYPITSLRMKRIAWMFNGWMILGCLFGGMMLEGLSRITGANQHKGPGWVSYGESEPEKVSEAEYKRHTRGEGMAALFMGLMFWLVVAWAYRDNRRKERTEARWNEARRAERQAYLTALRSALDDATRERAEAEAEAKESPEYRAALAEESRVRMEYNEARRSE